MKPKRHRSILVNAYVDLWAFLLGFLVTATIIGLVILLASCTTLQPGIQPEAIDGLVRAVADRHDAYVTADETLDPYDRATYLRSTEILRQVLDAAKRQP